MLSPSGPMVKRIMYRQQMSAFRMLHVNPDFENTLYVPGNGWFHVRRPETRCVRATVSSASTTHARCSVLEYTRRRPSPEPGGKAPGGNVVVVGGGGNVSVAWIWVPRSGVELG